MARPTPDPTYDWLGHMGQVGLVVAPPSCPATAWCRSGRRCRTRPSVAELLSRGAARPRPGRRLGLPAPRLGWKPGQVAGSPGGPPVPEDLVRRLPEGDTVLAPTLAVAEPGGARVAADGAAEAAVAAPRQGRGAGRGPGPPRRSAGLGGDAAPALRAPAARDRRADRPAADRPRTAPRPRPARGDQRLARRPLCARSAPSPAARCWAGSSCCSPTSACSMTRRTGACPPCCATAATAQAEVSAKLATPGARRPARVAAWPARGRAGRASCVSPGNARTHLYEGLLAVLLRLVFLLYAEDRDLIPSRTDAEARALYDQGYGVRRLHARLLDDQARNPDTMDERRGAWGRLLALFRLVHRGDGSGLDARARRQAVRPRRLPVPHGPGRARRSARACRPSPTAACCACSTGCCAGRRAPVLPRAGRGADRLACTRR